MQSAPSGNGDWRRQAARFAAVSSTMIGIGTALAIFLIWRDARKSAPAPKPPKSEMLAPASR